MEGEFMVDKSIYMVNQASRLEFVEYYMVALVMEEWLAELCYI